MKENDLKSLFCNLEDSAVTGHFSSWSLGKKSSEGDFFATGFYADESCNPAFDLASLTKPLFLGVFCRMALKENENNWWNLPFSDSFFDKIPHNFRKQLEIISQLTPFHLLNHQAGFQPWFWFGRGLWHHHKEIAGSLFPTDAANKAQQEENLLQILWQKAFENHSKHSSASKSKQEYSHVYSDVGYFVLTQICRWLFSNGLTSQHFWSNILSKINKECFLEGANKLSHIQCFDHQSKKVAPFFPYYLLDSKNEPETLLETFGACHDTNANILASNVTASSANPVFSLHAGMFGSIKAVCAATNWIRNFDREYFPTYCDYSNANEQKFWRGLDTPSGANSLYSPSQWPLAQNQKLVGHLGYTGTSFCFSEETSQALLLNRTAKRSFLHREELNLKKIRLIAVENNSEKKYFLCQSKSGSTRLEAIAPAIFEEIQAEYSRFGQVVWNVNSICTASNVSQLRKQSSEALWKKI